MNTNIQTIYYVEFADGSRDWLSSSGLAFFAGKVSRVLTIANIGSSKPFLDDEEEGGS